MKFTVYLYSRNTIFLSNSISIFQYFLNNEQLSCQRISNSVINTNFVSGFRISLFKKKKKEKIKNKKTEEKKEKNE